MKPSRETLAKTGRNAALKTEMPFRSADICDAFISDVSLPGASTGALKGLTFGVKDNFAVKGHITGDGHPDWAASHKAAPQSAPAVQALLEAGADLIGMTHMDELAFSLDGQNAHYGCPENPASPGHLAGGSSSGSASAVAGGLCDFALGTDTAGSIRVPASQCGLFSLRPTHGRISTKGVAPLSPQYDTVGWFTRSADLLQEVGRELLGEDRSPTTIKRLVIDPAVFALVDEPYAKALLAEAERISAPLGGLEKRELGIDVKALSQMFGVSRSRDVWQALGSWLQETKPTLGRGVADRFKAAEMTSAKEADAADAACAAYTMAFEAKLTPDEALFMPVTPNPAPIRTEKEEILATRRARLVELSALACVTGRPQAVFPALKAPAPIGLSLIGFAGQDCALLDLVQTLYR